MAEMPWQSGAWRLGHRFPNRSGHEINESEVEAPTDVAATQYEAPQRDGDVGALDVYGLQWTVLDLNGR